MLSTHFHVDWFHRVTVPISHILLNRSDTIGIGHSFHNIRHYIVVSVSAGHCRNYSTTMWRDAAVIFTEFWSMDKCLALLTSFHAGFSFGLFFNPEDGGHIFNRNVGWLSTDYTPLYLRRYCSSLCATDKLRLQII
jgi:hypothetical protein